MCDLVRVCRVLLFPQPNPTEPRCQAYCVGCCAHGSDAQCLYRGPCSIQAAAACWQDSSGQGVSACAGLQVHVPYGCAQTATPASCTGMEHNAACMCIGGGVPLFVHRGWAVAACSSLVGQSPSSGDGFSAFWARRPDCCCSMCSCASSTLRHGGVLGHATCYVAHHGCVVLHSPRLCMRMHAGLMHGRCCHRLQLGLQLWLHRRQGRCMVYTQTGPSVAPAWLVVGTAAQEGCIGTAWA